MSSPNYYLFFLLSVLQLPVSFALGRVRSHSLPSHRRSLSPPNWFHHPSHPVYQLFSRGPDESFPTVGSKEWKAAFPSTVDNDTPVPDTWLSQLANVTAAGLIPDIPQSKATDSDPIYPNGTDPHSDEVCSSTYAQRSGCRHPNDVWDAPDGRLGISFDDGPLPHSPTLYSYLKSQGQKATHFFIGVNILQYPDVFMQAFQDNQDDIAVHTYTHPALTTLSNKRIVAELGWTLELIRQSTGGRISRYYRPPYGDSDNRVRAIAEHVFGLTTVMWNHDSLDWELPEGPMTADRLHQNYTAWYTGPKSPGIIVLSHELTKESIEGWIRDFPLIRANGWDARPIPDLFGGGGWYVNAENSTAEVVPGVEVAQNGGQPVWDGYSAQIASLGTTTHLEFHPTVSGSIVGVTPTTSASANSSRSPNSATPHDSPLPWFLTLMFLISCCTLSL